MFPTSVCEYYATLYAKRLNSRVTSTASLIAVEVKRTLELQKYTKPILRAQTRLIRIKQSHKWPPEKILFRLANKET